MRPHLIGIVLAHGAMISAPAVAQSDPTAINIPYSSASSRTIGDAVNIDFPNSALGRCIAYGASDVKWDTTGAISSKGSVYVVSSFVQEKSESDLDLGYQTTAKIKAGVFNADSSFDLNYRINRLRNDQDRTVTVVFRAFADYGRYLIEDYKPANGISDLIKGNISEFRQTCGTHFIRGQRRMAELALHVNISTSSRTGKDVLTTSLTQKIGGGVGLDGISGEGAATLRAAYKSILEFARESGTVNIDYSALGGPGIEAAGKTALASDPLDMAKLASTVSSVASLFTQQNSSISGYVIQANTSIGAPPVDIDIARTAKIGSLTRMLIRAKQADERYEAYRAKVPSFYNIYFAARHVELTALRANLVDKINKCAAGSECVDLNSDILLNYPFLEDMFSSSLLTNKCQYQKASKLSPVNGKLLGRDPEVLESISVNISAETQHFDAIDFTSLSIKQLSDELKIKDVSAAFSGFSFSAANAAGKRRVFGTIYAENLKPAALIRFDQTKGYFSVDEVELQKRREKVLGAAFVITAPGPAGYRVSHEAGFPPRADCPLIR